MCSIEPRNRDTITTEVHPSPPTRGWTGRGSDRRKRAGSQKCDFSRAAGRTVGSTGRKKGSGLRGHGRCATRSSILRVSEEVSAVFQRSSSARTYCTNILKIMPVRVAELPDVQGCNPDETLSEIQSRLFRKEFRDIQPYFPVTWDPRVDERRKYPPITIAALTMEGSPDGPRLVGGRQAGRS